VTEESGRGGAPVRQATEPLRPPRAELGLAAFVAAVGVFLLVQTARLRVPATSNVVGPTFFPNLVGVALIVAGVLLAVEVLRGRAAEPEAGEDVDPTRPTDWRTLGLLLAALVAHLLLMLLVGYVLAAAALFWGAAFALGSRRWLRDAAVGVLLGVVLYVAFTRGLGLRLPEGAIEAVL
jgi:putative tricarboxylic transport membrane protein